MSEPFIAEIDILPYTFVPLGWAPCDGELLHISQNTALFSLIGTLYGGDGMTTMGLPDLQGRAPAGEGRGPGLSAYRIGEIGGLEGVTLTATELPAHDHVFAGEGGFGSDEQKLNSTVAAGRIDGALTQLYDNNPSTLTTMAPQSLGASGSNQPHENRQPFLALNFCIALIGIYPSRS